MDANSYILTASVAAAILSILRNQVINRRRATVDLVLHQRSDLDLKAANSVVNPLLHANDITRFAAEDQKESGETKAILDVLNNYEFVASGIKEKAFDFKLYKRMRYQMVIRDWEKFKAFVYHLRSSRNHPTLFQDFEWLATKFKDKPLKKNNKNQ